MSLLLRFPAILTSFFILFCLSTSAQTSLQKKISLNLTNAKVFVVLNEIETQGNFHLAYDGRIIKRDSLISISIHEEPILTALTKVFGNRFEFQENGNHIIVRKALSHLAITDADLVSDNGSYSVSGHVIDVFTGQRMMNASVYSKEHLISVLTDEHGHFKLKFRAGDTSGISVTASKIQYKDTTLHFLKSVSVSTRYSKDDYGNQQGGVERTGLGTLFISGKQMIQSLNISDFFATRPFQVSLTPGLSTHGNLSAQVINKVSFNLLGGYTAGVNGLEAGLLFNINKRDTRYLQLAGIFNLVGGNATGIQLAGIHNRALDSVQGVQLSFFSNQAGKQLSGAQISAFHNKTSHLKGLQIGLINVADTSEGASIGIINIIRNGFYRIRLSSNDLTNTNLELQTGTNGFYSVLSAGANLSGSNKLYAFGLGIGHNFQLSSKWYIAAEAGYKFAYTGLWDDRWSSLKLSLNYQLNKNWSIFAGPVFNHYKHSGRWLIEGYKNVTNIPVYPTPSNPYQTKNWIGWEAGLAFNSVFNPQKKDEDLSRKWFLGFAGSGGITFNDSYKNSIGGEIYLQRDLGESLAGVFSIGYTYFDAKQGILRYQEGDTRVYVQPAQFIPVKVGVRIKSGKHFYFGGDLGLALGNKQEGYEIDRFTRAFYTQYSRVSQSFMYSVNAGYTFSNGLETGLKFDDYGLQTQLKQIGIRLGYRLKLSH